MIANTNGSMVLNGSALNHAKAFDPVEEFAVIGDPRLEATFHIRSYRKSDHDDICRLCCDTGYMGYPVDTFFHDRELFADLFTRPYLNHEPEWGMVVEADGKVVGYLLGSVSRYFDWFQMFSGFQTSMKMVTRILTGRYAGHPRSRQFVRWLFTAGLKEQPKHPHNAAHMHWELHKDYRGRGIARQMWLIYERRLREAGIRRCYGSFFSHPKRRPEAAYARFGFRVFDRCRTTLFEPEISEPVEVVCVSKDL